MNNAQKTFLDNLLLDERKCICHILLEEEYSDEDEKTELEGQLTFINDTFGALSGLELVDG